MSAITVYRRPTAVLNLRGGLPVVGHIKIGKKGKAIESRRGNWFQPPEKLDHFRITTVMRGEDGNFLLDEELHSPKMYGPEPKELPVRLLYNQPELNFTHSYMAYDGKKPWCFGDGVTAWRLTGDSIGTRERMPCMCEYYTDASYTGNKKCKIAGRLSVVIDGAAQVGGVWDFRTGSINTVDGIQASLDMLMAGTGGWVAGIPLLMTVRPQIAQLPSGQTSEIFVVRLQYNGSMEQMRKYALEKAEGDLKFGGRMKEIEAKAKKLLLAAPAEDDDGEIIEEFFPGAAAAEMRRNGNGEPPLEVADKQPIQDTRTVLREAQRQLEAEDPEFGREREMGREANRTDAPTSPTVELWDAEGEEHVVLGAMVEDWLVSQLSAIDSIVQLNRFAAANEDETSRYVAEKIDAKRAELLAGEEKKPEVPAARHARGGRRQQAAKEATDDQLPIMVRWPGNENANRYTVEDFVSAYQRRRRLGGSDFEREFREASEQNNAVWKEYVSGGEHDQ